MGIDSARDRILRAVRDVPDVLSANATVKPVRGKADVELDVVVSHESISVPEKQREIDRALRQVINKQLGLQMAGKPRVHIRLDDEKVEALPAPTTPETPEPPEPPAAVVVAPVAPIQEEVVAEPEPLVAALEPDDASETVIPLVDDEDSDDLRDLPSFG